MKLSKLTRALVVSSLLLCALLGIVIQKNELWTLEGETGVVETTYYVPKAKFIRPFLLGHEAFLADLIWIRTLGYFADEVMGRRKFTYLADLLDLATDLDPRFEKVYIWAGAILMYRGGRITEREIRASNSILEKGWNFIEKDTEGWRHVPDYWAIPQMIGFNYAIELHDKKKGAPFIAATARIPGSPHMYKTWAATLYKNAGDLEGGTRLLENMLAIETLQSQLQNVKETAIQDQIRIRLQMYYGRLYGSTEAAQRLAQLEKEILALVTEWRETLPLAPFTLFLILRPETENIAEQESADLWTRLFPNMTLGNP